MRTHRWMWPVVLLLVSGFLGGPTARAYTDTVGGPIATAAKAALDKGDVTTVLRWVKPEQEEELRAAFQAAAVVRTKGPEAQALADKYFSETLVRLHRLSRNEPYTGLQPANTEAPIIGVANKVLDAGTPDELTKAMIAALNEGIVAHYNAVTAAKATADATVEAGRDYVDVYEEYLSYINDLYALTQRDAAEDDQDAAGDQEPMPAAAPGGKNPAGPAAQGTVAPTTKAAARQAAKGKRPGGGKKGVKRPNQAPPAVNPPN